MDNPYLDRQLVDTLTALNDLLRTVAATQELIATNLMAYIDGVSAVGADATIPHLEAIGSVARVAANDARRVLYAYAEAFGSAVDLAH